MDTRLETGNVNVRSEIKIKAYPDELKDWQVNPNIWGANIGHGWNPNHGLLETNKSSFKYKGCQWGILLTDTSSKPADLLAKTLTLART